MENSVCVCVGGGGGVKGTLHTNYAILCKSERYKVRFPVTAAVDV